MSTGTVRSHRRPVVAAVVVVLALSAAIVVTASHNGGQTPAPGAEAHRAPPVTRPARQRSSVPTPTAKVPETPVQQRIDRELATAETPAAIAAAERTPVPAPAISAAYPGVPAEDRADPTAYAIAFVTELLDTNYRSDSRAELLSWAEHEEAANTLPGVPRSVANKALALSLADPSLPGVTASPVPSAAGWSAEALHGVVRHVSGMAAEVDPDWTEIVSEGWQPADPRMTIETVTGTVVVRTAGQSAVPRSFALTVTLGSAAHHRGYGAVAVSEWTVK